MAQLKQQKQVEQEQFVSVQRERQFKQNTPEIRNIGVRYQEQKNNHDLQVQMFEKQQNLVDNYQGKIQIMFRGAYLYQVVRKGLAIKVN